MLDKQGRILSMHYTGTISVRDMENFWIEAISKELIKSDVKGFILDCGEAIFEIEEDETSLLTNFFRKNISIFHQKKFAYITKNPNQVIVPILLQEEEDNYESRPFSTKEAALDWLLY